jgi:hypothetical protein
MNVVIVTLTMGAHDNVVGLGAMLQVGRSRFESQYGYCIPPQFT